MPELTDLIPWDNLSWDNMSVKMKSGEGVLARRPYFYKVMGYGKGRKLLIISAVHSKEHPDNYHADDYLRLTKEGFDKLVQLGQQVWG